MTGHLRMRAWKRGLGGAVGTLSAAALAVLGLAVPAETAAAAEDVTPPMVTGTLVTEPNSSGWFNRDVTVRWNAVDTEPSSGLVGVVPDTQVTAEGAGLTAISEPVCDAAGNCATGELTGINIDRTAPTITIIGVEDGATYQLGSVPSVTCEATDALSGVVGDCALTGYGSNLGSWTITAEATDAAGNAGSTSVGYTVTASAARVTGTVRDQSGNLLPGTAIEARQAGTANLVASTVANTDGVYSLTLPAGTYDFTVTGPAGTGLGARVPGREIPAGVTTIDWTIGLMSVRLSGVVSDGVETANYGMLRFYDVNGIEAGQAQLEADGSWEAELVAGVYRIHFGGSSPRIQFLNVDLRPQGFWADAEVAVRPVLTELIVHLRDAAGLPAAGLVRMTCGFAPAGQDLVTLQSLNSWDSGLGEIALWGAPTPVGDRCELMIDPEVGPSISRAVTLTAGGPTDLTIQIDRGVRLSGVASDGSGPAAYGFLRFWDSAGVEALRVEIGPDGSWEAYLLPGSYQIAFSGSSPRMKGMEFFLPRRVFDADTVVDVRPTVSDVFINLNGPDGLPASGRAELECSYRLGSLYQHTNAIGSGTGQIALLGTPTPDGSACQLRVYPDDGPNITRTITVAPDVPNIVDLQVEEGVHLSGVATDGVEPAYHGFLRFYDSAGVQALHVDISADGSWEANLVPGTYEIRFSGSSDRLSYFEFEMAPRVFDVDMVVDVRPTVTEVAVHLLGADGRPASGWAEMLCNFRLGPPYEDLYQYVNAVAYDFGRIALLGVPTPEGSTCQLRIYPDDGPDITRSITVTADGPNDITLFTFGAGLTLIGDPETSNDGDNVADAIEAFAPNGGDGNNDGVPDFEQENVTSLPVLGGALGGGTVYVTVAAPEGTSLTNVYTIDPGDETQVSTPPPAGVSLPEGLTKFIVEGVNVGSDQTISIYTSSTDGLAGYAKYDIAAGEWSLLPSDRVAIHPDRVDITLTDGGVGDADGVANGVIDDPGALVVITDVTPPAVSITGLADGATYGYGEVPVVGCEAVDDMSGLAGECELSGYGTAPGPWRVTATATDLVGNVGTVAATYTVEPWDLRGFHAPVNPGVLNTVKAGATVPLKFEVFSGDSELLDTSVIGASFTVHPMLCGTSTVEDPVEFTTTGSTSLRYDEDGGAFIQNWKTPSLPGCYLVKVETDDGSSVSAAFKLK